ncbi:MAG: PIN domain-containing protein [Candidatus Micrarchaeia archaeon]
MDLIVDTNIVVSAILKKGITRNLLFHPDITLFSPAYLKEELQKT